MLREVELKGRKIWDPDGIVKQTNCVQPQSRDRWVKKLKEGKLIS